MTVKALSATHKTVLICTRLKLFTLIELTYLQYDKQCLCVHFNRQSKTAFACRKANDSNVSPSQENWYYTPAPSKVNVQNRILQLLVSFETHHSSLQVELDVVLVAFAYGCH